METEESQNIRSVSDKIEQLADEFIWAKQKRDIPNVHRDLGHDLWEMWKGIFFIETGNKDMQKKEKTQGNLRVCSEYGMKIWDDDGVACVVQSALREKLQNVGEQELSLMREMCSAEGFRLLSLLDANTTVSKEELHEKCGIELSVLNTLLITFMENGIVEYVSRSHGKGGYKLSGHCGISAYMVLAAAFILSKRNYTVSEFTTVNS